MNPTNRIALITGASRGLGRSMALHLAEHGIDVVATYRSGASEARALVADVESRGRKAVALPLRFLIRGNLYVSGPRNGMR